MLLRAGPSSLALPRAARLGSVGPRPHLLASTSPSSPRHMHTPPSHFDTHALVARLESSGLTRQQASELVASLHAAVSSAVANLEASLIPRAEAERWRYSQKVDFARLKSEIQLLERNEFAIMKSENERLMADVEKLKQKLREEITRTTAGVRLDLNLEKGASRARGRRALALLASAPRLLVLNLLGVQAASETSRPCTPSRSKRSTRASSRRLRRCARASRVQSSTCCRRSRVWRRVRCVHRCGVVERRSPELTSKPCWLRTWRWTGRGECCLRASRCRTRR